MPPVLPEAFRSYLPSWPLDRENEEKHFFETTQRICDPEETWSRFSPFRERAGITRLSDITYLDCVGIPTYQAVRPQVDHYRENISVYNGKGLTKLQAKVSAMMEAFERCSGEVRSRPLLLKTFEEISKEGVAVSPTDLTLPEGESYLPHEPLEWAPGLDLISEEPVWLPAAQVFCPYRPIQGGRFFPNFSNSNGLASGNSYGEAISHALFEVIERDAESTAWASKKAVTIDLDSIENPLIRELIDKFADAGIQLVLKELFSDIGFPVFSAAADEPATEDPALLCYGMGCHLNPEIAAMRAITEVAQSRCALISGLRGDLTVGEWKRGQNYHELKRQLSYWFDPGLERKALKPTPQRFHSNFVDDVQAVLDRLEDLGFRRVIVVNLTSSDIPVPVVRVVVPELEQSLESHRRGRRFKASIR